MADASGEIVVPFEYEAYEDVSPDGKPFVLGEEGRLLVLL